MIVLTSRSPFLRERLVEDPASFDDVPWFFLAHELAHQWGGQGVGGQNYRERWLSEGMAQYAAALWVQHTRGERTFRGVLRRLARWALRAGPAGPIQLGFRLGHLQRDPQVYRAIVYDKGAYVLHMLRGLVGDEAFFRSLRTFQERERYTKAGTDDLREVMEEVSGRDLKPYFDAWVYGTDVPALRAEWRTSPVPGGQRTEVTVHAEHVPGPLPLDLTLRNDANTVERRVTLAPGGGRFTFDTAFKPTRIELNANGALLATDD
jgi:aminopeptidase N